MMILRTQKWMQRTFSLLLISLVVLSCQKEDNKIENPNVTPPSSMERINSFLSNNAPKVQKFGMEVNDNFVVEGERGTKIEIPANAFVDQNGNAVTGTITVELKEMYSAGSMILANKPTVSNGQRLNSGGEIYLNATQRGNDLRLAAGKSLGVKMPTNSFDPNMGVFTGTGSGDNFNWLPNPNVVMQQCGGDSITGDTTRYYCFGLDSLFKWINCDYYNSDPRPLTGVDVVVPSGFDNTNTVVFIHVPVDRSVVKVNSYANNIFSVTGGYRLPVGLNVNFLALHSDSQGNIYYALQNNTVTQNHVETMVFQQVTQVQLVQIIQNL